MLLHSVQTSASPIPEPSIASRMGHKCRADGILRNDGYCYPHNKRKRANPVVQNLGILHQLKQSPYIHNEPDLRKVVSQQPITKENHNRSTFMQMNTWITTFWLPPHSLEISAPPLFSTKTSIFIVGRCRTSISSTSAATIEARELLSESYSPCIKYDIILIYLYMLQN